MMKSILCTVILSVAVAAQRPARAVAVLEVGVEAAVTKTGVLTCLLRPSPGVQTGVTVPGALAALASDQFLVAGRDDVGHGLIEHWKLGAGSFQLQDAYAVPGSDFTGVAYDAGLDKLYLLDCSSDRIIRGDWDGDGVLPTTWLPWATTADVPALQSSGEHYLGLHQPAGLPAQVYLGPFPDIYAFAATLVSGEPGSIVTTPFSWIDVATAATVLADQRTASEGGTTISVSAPSGTQVEVVHAVTSSVIGSGTVPIGHSSVVVTVSPALALGEAYVARAVGDPVYAHQALFCMRRYGFPEAYADGTQLTRVTHPEDLRVGNAGFILVAGANKHPAPAADSELTGYLAIGFRDGAGVDPVASYGGNNLLMTDVYVPAVGSVSSITGQGLLHGEIPVPADPNLEGKVVLFQFWMSDGGSIRRSEVVGIKVGPQLPEDESSGQRQSRVRPGKSPEQAWIDDLIESGRATRSAALLEGILRQSGQ